jgi:hypothetical protein
MFVFGRADGGTITLSDVSFDPTDPAQNTLRTNVENAIKLINSSTSGIRFWINSTSFYTIGTSGHILLTKGGAVRADRNGLAKTDYEGQISGAFMYLAESIV